MVGPKAAALGNAAGEHAVSNGKKKLEENLRLEPNMALDRLKESEPTEWLMATPGLVDCAKQASELLFSLSATSFGKAPLSKLYTDRFDAEQIWQQIDLQSHPIISYIRRKVRNLEGSINDDFFTGLETDGKGKAGEKKTSTPDEVAVLAPDGSLEDESDDGSDDEEIEDADDDDDDEDETEKEGGVEDEFFKLGEMEKFLERTDAEGVFGTGEDGREAASGLNEEEGEEDEDDEDDEDFGEDFNVGTSDAEDGEEKELGFGKYEDFFGSKEKQKKQKQKSKPLKDGNEEEISDDERRDVADASQGLLETKSVEVEKLSAHERKQEGMEKRIKQLEKANLDPKDWTQQGEVTAKRRPVNSALEVELDFEHNVRPPPVITEEVTSSLEDMIKARIAEGRFDDVQRRPAGPVAAVREHVELDETKSREGLGDIYEAEYMQSSGLAAAPTPTSEALKEEARLLFRALCSRLDALSHFHYAPKPVVDDMGVRADVPALAMEEVAPLAVSDASMLAPEEIFMGEGAVKAESELTREERKRRRGQKKRKRKGERRAQEAEKMRKRIRTGGLLPPEAKPTRSLKVGHSSYTKSSKMFAELANVKHLKGKAPPQKGARETEKPVHASFLKL